MRIALFPNTAKKPPKNIAISIAEFLSKRGVEIVMDGEESALAGVLFLRDVDPDSIDYILSLGGDGTILQIVHEYSHIRAPLLGINLGSLGFMADVPATDIYPTLEDLLDGQFTIQKRMVMAGSTTKGEPCFAINEVVVHRGQNPSLIDLAIHVDGKYLNTFSADGVIVATPNGSTAYSLAAGGPILAPDLEAFVITPISPHTISNRPIVLLPQESIQVQYLSPYRAADISYDGFSHFPMEMGEVLSIKRFSRSFDLVKMHRYDFFSTWRSKLAWTGKLKS